MPIIKGCEKVVVFLPLSVFPVDRIASCFWFVVECVKCRFGALCERDNSGLISCVCPPSDTPSYYVPSPVCGTDNRTYPSSAHLERESCLQQELVLPLYNGKCEDGKQTT